MFELISDPNAYEYAKKLFEVKPDVDEDDTKMKYYEKDFENEIYKEEDEVQRLQLVSIKQKQARVKSFYIKKTLFI